MNICPRCSSPRKGAFCNVCGYRFEDGPSNIPRPAAANASAPQMKAPEKAASVAVEKSSGSSNTRNIIIISVALVLVLAAVTALIIFGGSGSDKYADAWDTDPTPAVMETPMPTAAAADGKQSSDKKTAATKSDTDSHEPFYGIWCGAFLNNDSAASLAEQLCREGFDAEVIVSSEWDGLNQTTYYVVTAARCYTKNDADALLKTVSVLYPDAYVKYTGRFIGD